MLAHDTKCVQSANDVSPCAQQHIIDKWAQQDDVWRSVIFGESEVIFLVFILKLPHLWDSLSGDRHVAYERGNLHHDGAHKHFNNEDSGDFDRK